MLFWSVGKSFLCRMYAFFPMNFRCFEYLQLQTDLLHHSQKFDSGLLSISNQVLDNLLIHTCLLFTNWANANTREKDESVHRQTWPLISLLEVGCFIKWLSSVCSVMTTFVMTLPYCHSWADFNTHIWNLAGFFFFFFSFTFHQTKILQ